MTIFIGIDPGLSGAIAAIDTTIGGVLIEDMPTKDAGGGGLVKTRVDGRALAELLRRLAPARDGPNGAIVTCELVHAIAGMREGRQGTMQSMGSMMRTFGAVEAIIDAMRLHGAYVKPQAWKGIYDLKVEERDLTKRYAMAKAKAREVAMQLYPQAQELLKRVKDHNRAEALLIAHYGLTRHA